MKNSSCLISILMLMLILFSCSDKSHKLTMENKGLILLVQPFNDLKPESVKFVSNEIRKIYPDIKILNAIDLPKEAYHPERKRYKADSVIRFLNNRTDRGYVTIGLTSKDISTTKGKIKDFGIMGLGYRPGKACVASNFRLNKAKADEQLFKIAIHELGHTQGLEHCPEKTCFMRSAEGKNPTDEEVDFCKKCKAFLINKNWKFNSI